MIKLLFLVAAYAINLGFWLGAGLGFVLQFKGDGFQLGAFMLTMGCICGAMWSQALIHEAWMKWRRR